MKEKFEWIHSWLDTTDATDKKRVLLIGDSICNGYQDTVRELLREDCYVDYLATSHSVDSEFYRSMVGGIAKDSKYDLIHYNFGLHGFHMNREAYRRNYEEMLKSLMECAPVSLALSTIVYEPGNAKLDDRQTGAAKERNEEVLALAGQYGLAVDDLWSVSCQVPMEGRSEDGIHYEDLGWGMLAKAVADFIRNRLQS